MVDGLLEPTLLEPADSPLGHGTNQHEGRPDREMEQIAALLELQSIVQVCSSPQEGSDCIAKLLAGYLQADLVGVGLVRNNALRWVGVSEPTIDARDDSTQLVRAVLQEAASRQRAACWPAEDARERYGLLAHRQLLEHLGGECILSTPLRTEGNEVVGALFVRGRDEAFDTARARQFLRVAEQPLASTLRLLVRSHGTRVERGIRTMLTALDSRRRTWIAIATTLAIALMFLPIPMSIRCRCELQPAVRRFVAAPFHGRLDASLVEPGEIVQAGQVLARIDGKDLAWQLSTKQAQLHQVEKQRVGYLASHESGPLDIATLERDRLALEIAHLEQQASRLEIRSPLDGLVVQGDLAKSQGVPIEQGTTLFEIAPLEEMVLELAIPESDVRFVKTGMTVEARLDAYPKHRRSGRIERIHPRSELRETDNVFIAELHLDNTSLLARPGMRGTARVSAGKQPLGWLLFRQSVSAVLRWTGW